MAQEVGFGTDEAFYAATPPLEAKRNLMSRRAREQSHKEHPLKLQCLDVKKAYANGTPTLKYLPPSYLGTRCGQIRCGPASAL